MTNSCNCRYVLINIIKVRESAFFLKKHLDTCPITSKYLEKFYHIDGSQLERHYKEHLSNYNNWDQKDHAQKWLLFPENMGTRLIIDETALSNGELYTIVTNKEAKGRKGAIVSIILGTKSEEICNVLDRIPEEKLNKVEEITLDMSKAMGRIVRYCFPFAKKIIDRFHVQSLAFDALQEIRIANRWDAIDYENCAMKKAKILNKKYIPEILENGDTPKQLLARSRYLLFKSPNNWSKSQKARAKVLFERYSDVKEAYSLTYSLRMSYNKHIHRDVARLSLARWYNKVADSKFKSFNIISATIYEHYEEILNFFTNRYTNASAESFNAKIKSYRASLRGITDISFFLYRLINIHA